MLPWIRCCGSTAASADRPYAGREVERILYVRAATLNSILWETGNQRSDRSSKRACEILGCSSTTRASEFWTRWSSGWTKLVLRTRLNYSNLALRRRWSRPASAPRRVVVVAGCAEAPRCDSCTSCTPLRRGRRTPAWNRISHRAISVLTISWRQRRRPC